MSVLNRLSLGLGLVFLYAPIAVLVVFSFNASSLVTVWGRILDALVRGARQ